MNTCTRYAAKVYRVVQPRRTIRHVCLYRGAVHRVTSRTRGAPIAHVTLAEMYVHQLRVRAYTQCRCNRLLAPLPPVPLGIQYSRSPVHIVPRLRSHFAAKHFVASTTARHTAPIIRALPVVRRFHDRPWHSAVASMRF